MEELHPTKAVLGVVVLVLLVKMPYKELHIKQGNGGDGVANTISGISTYYAGGGGGSNWTPTSINGFGGLGGGGAGKVAGATTADKWCN
ncbi:MAG UNVERIFIED_CONTAM: hypothetical protein LVR29_32050 [Microcystis novacekii LVE1205-3]